METQIRFSLVCTAKHRSRH